MQVLSTHIKGGKGVYGEGGQGCEGPEDLDLAVQSGEVSVARVRRAKGEEAWEWEVRRAEFC